jgi:hypothetical protein
MRSISSHPRARNRQLVVRYHQSAALRRRQMIQNDDRNFRHLKFSGGEKPCVPGDDIVVGSDEDRIGPAPFPNRSRDVGDLLSAVRAWIICPRHQALDRPTLDLNVHFNWSACVSGTGHTPSIAIR